ncbi:type IV pilus twitching motility protein PilT [Fodinisporobacter ferrooxydans]|uniref:Type IV pilus twitching motility protein PilT n=2 Tax=Fodinisporobacter ferrooxydans TaxID=2901836 RepID=A0ABY4CTF3_9BACL|nr:type IV pilus twitching motility protein PilT [Alicyclobacillaceae bacterium MYW30-H2]
MTVGAPPTLRIHGSLKAVGETPLQPSDTLEILKQIVSNEQLHNFHEAGELDFSYGVPNVSRFRINAFRQRSCVSLSVRVVPTRIPTMEELNLPAVLKQFAYRPQGLLLVTGPTGSGKSTTLASLIDLINRTQRKHIITLEDPIEYLHKHQMCLVDQREVGFDTRSFASGLRAALRQDPDVVLVGEMRDLETIQTAITAAETGHLVFATLHTSDAPQTIDRIIDVFPAYQQQQIRIQLASVLVGIVAQRLIPMANGDGRVGAYEILANTNAIANLIRSEKVHQIRSMMQTGRSQGMQTMDMHLRELVSRGIISEASAKDSSPTYAESRL